MLVRLFYTLCLLPPVRNALSYTPGSVLDCLLVVSAPLSDDVHSLHTVFHSVLLSLEDLEIVVVADVLSRVSVLSLGYLGQQTELVLAFSILSVIGQVFLLHFALP